MPETSGASQAAAVIAESLSKRFGSVLAVDDPSFALAPGTITGFLGPNGAGKTATLRMLLGLVKPSSGSASIFGHRYSELARSGPRVGAVPRGDRLPSGPLRPSEPELFRVEVLNATTAVRARPKLLAADVEMR